jgi:hypothetical protein
LRPLGLQNFSTDNINWLSQDVLPPSRLRGDGLGVKGWDIGSKP